MAKLIHLLTQASLNPGQATTIQDATIAQQVKDLVARAHTGVTPFIPSRSTAADITKIKLGAVIVLASSEGHT